MHTLNAGYCSLSLLFTVNWDRLLYIVIVLAALMGGAFVGSLWAEPLVHPYQL